MIRQYIVVRAPALDKLEEMVNEKIKDGFEPVGGVFIIQPIAQSIVICQPMRAEYWKPVN